MLLLVRSSKFNLFELNRPGSAPLLQIGPYQQATLEILAAKGL